MANIHILTVSTTFREQLAIQYPKLGRNSAYWLMIGHLMFSKFFDEETQRIVINAEVLAEIEGKGSQFITNNYHAEDFLKRFSKDIVYLEWSKWSFLDKKARVITKLDWNLDVLELIDKERKGIWNDKGRVFLDNGNTFTKNRISKFMKEDHSDALSLVKNAGCSEAKELLDYLNNLSPSIFNKLLKNMPMALETAERLPKDADRQIDILTGIVDAYMPFYKPVSSSVRIYPFDQNMLCLQRDVRKALTKGWLEFDLKNAQLAIAAKTWEIKKVQQFLESGQSFWEYLSASMDVELTSDNKRILKSATYAIMYGATQKKLETILENLPVADTLSKFNKNPIIKSLLYARRKQFKKIVNDKGAYDCFGNWIVLEKKKKKRSVLARLNQAYELKLLYPVLQIAVQGKNSQQFKIVLWQHDGFSIKVAKEKSVGWWYSMFKMEVDSVAKESGISTRLEMTT